MDERMDALNGKRIVELLRKAAMGSYEGSNGKVMDNIAQLIGCYGAMDYRTIDKLADMVEEAIQHEHESAYDAGYDEGFASADDWCAQHEDAMNEHGWVRLPKDADGEYIHIGDVMEWIDLDGEVSVTCSVDAVGVDCFFAWDKGNGRYAQKYVNAYRHHHAPTVEDVLREMADRCYADEDEPRNRDAIVAEYAKRLRLAEE